MATQHSVITTHTSTSMPLASRIMHLREQKVMLDADLADLYGVQTKALVQAVKRNPARFPDDFMFQLDSTEWASLRSQTVTSNPARGGRRYPPYAFTEQGVAMLSSILTSAQAITVNIEIMRTFVRIRLADSSQKDLTQRLDLMESQLHRLSHSQDSFEAETRDKVRQIFASLRALVAPAEPVKKRPIGFVTPDVD